MRDTPPDLRYDNERYWQLTMFHWFLITSMFRTQQKGIRGMLQVLNYAPRARWLKTVVLSVVVASVLGGCSSEAEVGRYEVPLDESAEPAPQSVGMPRDAASESPDEVVTFDKPENWMAGEVGGLRKAAFVVEQGDQKVEITVIDLAASAAMLLPNINIWRQQIQLEESSAEEALPIEIGDLKGHYVELVGPEDAEKPEAILAVMVVRGPKSWFFKLKGDAELALAEKERFQQFVKSAKFQTRASRQTPFHNDARPVPERANGDEPLAFDTPAGWTTGQAGGMRRAAFVVKDGEQTVEITIIDLAAGAGELLPNINRWREQIQLGAMDAEKLQEIIRPVRFAGVEGHYVEMLDGGTDERRQAILGTIAVHAGRSWFVKLMGDTDLAAREKERFKEFVASIRFSADSAQPPPAEPPATPADPPPTSDASANEPVTNPPSVPEDGVDQSQLEESHRDE